MSDEADQVLGTAELYEAVVPCQNKIIMAALHSRCGHYIFALRFLLSLAHMVWP